MFKWLLEYYIKNIHVYICRGKYSAFLKKLELKNRSGPNFQRWKNIPIIISVNERKCLNTYFRRDRIQNQLFSMEMKKIRWPLIYRLSMNSNAIFKFKFLDSNRLSAKFVKTHFLIKSKNFRYDLTLTIFKSEAPL